MFILTKFGFGDCSAASVSMQQSDSSGTDTGTYGSCLRGDVRRWRMFRMLPVVTGVGGLARVIWRTSVVTLLFGSISDLRCVFSGAGWVLLEFCRRLRALEFASIASCLKLLFSFNRCFMFFIWLGPSLWWRIIDEWLSRRGAVKRWQLMFRILIIFLSRLMLIVRFPGVRGKSETDSLMSHTSIWLKELCVLMSFFKRSDFRLVFTSSRKVVLLAEASCVMVLAAISSFALF